MDKVYLRLKDSVDDLWNFWSDETRYRFTIEKQGGEGVYDRLRFFRQNLTRAGNRENPKEITIDKWYLEELYQKQKGRCVLSGLELEFTRGGTNWGGKWCNPKSCTVDRIDNNLGYIRENVQLVTWEINATKSHIQNQDFIRLCEHVVSYQKFLME